MADKLDIDKIRDIIANDALSHIRECEFDGITAYFVVMTFPGSGKTTSIMMAIDKAGYTWIYLAPYHEVIKENLQYSRLRNYDYIHFKGKGKVCLADKYKEFMNKGINIDAFCQTRCPYKDNGCPYYETKKEIESYPQSWAGVHSHVPTYLQTFLYQIEYNKEQMFKHFDVIILDEFPFQVLFNQVIIQRDDIDDLRNVIDKMNESPEKNFVMEFLNELSLATGDIELKYGKLKYLLEVRRNLDLKTFCEEYDNTLLRLVSNELIPRPPKPLLFNLQLLYDQNPDPQKLKWMVYKHKWDGWSTPGIYITTSNVDYFKNLPIPIIALDATADIDAWNTLLNDNCKYEKIDMEYKNLFQLRGAGRYPVASWIEITEKEKVLSKLGIRLCDLIIEICKRKKNAVLLCSNKRIKNKIEEYMKKHYDRENYQFAIYYNLRSRNEFYEDCDTCIVVHEPNIPPLQLDIMHNVIGWDTELLRDLMTTSEIKQAIGRIRQNILTTPDGRVREDVEIYILPGATGDETKFLPEAKVIPYANLFIGQLYTIRKVLMEAIKKAGNTTLTALKEFTQDLCSFRTLKTELKKLYLEGFISDFKRNIKWIYDEINAKKPKYRREYENHYQNF